MGSRNFEIDIVDQVAWLVLSRPDELNTFQPEFWYEFPQALARLGADGAVRALVVASTGRHFTAGLDLSAFGSAELFADGEPARANLARRSLILRMQEALTALERLRVPVLAAVQGGCIGGGVDLITACDMRYATADAFFTVQETKIGIPADLGTLQRLPRVIPDGLARELVYTGRRLPADQALAAGLVNQVFPDRDAMLRGVGEIAAEIVANSPVAVWGSKELLLHARDHTVADGLTYTATWQGGAFQPGEVAESVQARFDKRAARYQDLPSVTTPEQAGR
ncbi:enoyl-CoA hydratase [Frankia sp. CcI49]|uniref:enoyl-CoA hydratase-related protein n=1 Tax=unclassified Frankia TaxID=2632575 RepID=UPI0006CA02FA|nr:MULTISPECIES: enoyl-CoA hydratase-related protein [unclassified Frankia]KPM56450.1 enoyl-CoA hydratase [Frankia sp. R43]ONH62121.1 enoyl-CoA hydratase [Frankia sp. CcI49]